MLSIPCIIMFWVEKEFYGFPFTLWDTFLAGLQMFMCTIAVVCFSYSVQFGTATAVQSIENAKSIVQLGLSFFVLGLVPNYVQVFGLLCGLSGVLVIVL